MLYTLQNGRNVKIPDDEIQKSIDKLGLTKLQAIEMWLEDNDYLVNEEQENLDKKASKVKIDHQATSTKKTDKPKKTRTVKISDEKTSIFTDIKTFLSEKYNVNVLIDNKKLEISLNNRHFTVDLIENKTKTTKNQ